MATTKPTGASGAGVIMHEVTLSQGGRRLGLVSAPDSSLHPDRRFARAIAELPKDSPAFGRPVFGDPVQSALQETGMQEAVKKFTTTPYVCPSCSGRFNWAGALFLHLIQCDAFIALKDAAQ